MAKAKVWMEVSFMLDIPADIPEGIASTEDLIEHLRANDPEQLNKLRRRAQKFMGRVTDYECRYGDVDEYETEPGEIEIVGYSYN